MQESYNEVGLVGKVAEITHRKAKTRNGDKNYIAGEVMLQTGEDNIIPVSFFQNETTKDGKDNRGYTAMETMIEEFKTIAKDGPDEADIVEMSGGRLEENSYYSESGQLYRGFRTSGRFFNRRAGANAKNEFIVEGTIVNIHEEIKNDLPTGRLFIDLLVIAYGDRAHILKLVVRDEAGASYIKSSLSNGDEVKFAGEIEFSKVEEEITEEAAFGPPITRITSKVERNLVITSATAAKQSSLSQEEIQTALAEREGRLKEEKERTARKKSESKPQSTRGNFSL